MKAAFLPILALLAAPDAWAGGGPMNVMVLYNAEDDQAFDVALHYQTARELPEGHLCGIEDIEPGTREVFFETYEDVLLPQLEDCLAALPHPERVDYLVVVRGLPYRVALPDLSNYVGLNGLLHVYRSEFANGDPVMGSSHAFIESLGADGPGVENPLFLDAECAEDDLTLTNTTAPFYSSSCGIVAAEELPTSFRRNEVSDTETIAFADNLFVVTRLDGFDYNDAHDLIDRGVASDGTFPTAELLCMRGGDEARSARDPECEFAARHLASAGFNGTWIEAMDWYLSGHEVAAYFTGTSDLTNAIAGNSFVPGAIACNITSSGAEPTNFFCDESGELCPEVESQTSVARFVRAGATGVHGTVSEPINHTFPNAGTLLLYTFGYNLGESFFFNQRYVYWQNQVLGDPLATPFAERPVVSFWSETVAAGGTLEVRASHPNGIAHMELYSAGERVALSGGDSMRWAVPGSEGDSLDLTAVAFAENAVVSREDWPVDEHLPRIDTQGWSRRSVAIGPAVEASSCGCSEAGGRSGWWLALVASLVGRRGSRSTPLLTTDESGDYNRDTSAH